MSKMSFMTNEQVLENRRLLSDPGERMRWLESAIQDLDRGKFFELAAWYRDEELSIIDAREKIDSCCPETSWTVFDPTGIEGLAEFFMMVYNDNILWEEAGKRCRKG